MASADGPTATRSSALSFLQDLLSREFEVAKSEMHLDARLSDDLEGGPDGHCLDGFGFRPRTAEKDRNDHQGWNNLGHGIPLGSSYDGQLEEFFGVNLLKSRMNADGPT